MKKTVSISISEGVLENVRESAWGNRVSLSSEVERFLTSTSCVGTSGLKIPPGHSGTVSCDPEKPEIIIAERKVSQHLKERQELIAKVETPKGPVKANAALENFFKPQPKTKWKK